MGDPLTLAFAVTGMHCASCGILIDDAVEEIVAAIAVAGFTAAPEDG